MQNQPIVLRNFLVEAMRTSFTELSPEDIASLDLQMKMLVFQSLDHFDERQKLRPTNNPVSKPPPGALPGDSKTYQGTHPSNYDDRTAT